MTKIIGNTTATPNPRPDWNQTDETKADYIKNKPTDLATEAYVDEKVADLASSDLVTGIVDQLEQKQDKLTDAQLENIEQIPTIEQNMSQKASEMWQVVYQAELLASASETKANNAAINASTAVDTAGAARWDATEAKTKAEEALDKANKAEIKAIDAQNTAATATTAANNAESTANSALSIALGAQQAVSFADYETMWNTVKNYDSTQYKVGQNIMIVALGVPDLWVSGISNDQSTKEYTSDEDIVAKLENDETIQVGWYMLSSLQSEKVDLTDYATEQYVKDTIDGLIDSAPSELNTLGKISKALDNHIDDEVSHVTSEEKSTWNGKADAKHKHDDLYYTESEVDDLLASKASSLHDHSASNITSDTLHADRLPIIPITKGGTGAVTSEGARTAIGAAASNHDHDNDYAIKGHNHDNDYANKNHIHSASDIGAASSSHAHSNYDTHINTADIHVTAVKKAEWDSKASGGHTHSNYAVSNHTHSDYASSSHTHTKAQVGLGNVDNTSDIAKPVSSAQQAAINAVATTANNAVSIANTAIATAEMGRSITTTYPGNNNYGSSAPNSITVDKMPTLIVIEGHAKGANIDFDAIAIIKPPAAPQNVVNGTSKYLTTGFSAHGRSNCSGNSSIYPIAVATTNINGDNSSFRVSWFAQDDLAQMNTSICNYVVTVFF